MHPATAGLVIFGSIVCLSGWATSCGYVCMDVKDGIVDLAGILIGYFSVLEYQPDGCIMCLDL